MYRKSWQQLMPVGKSWRIRLFLALAYEWDSRFIDAPIGSGVSCLCKAASFLLLAAGAQLDLHNHGQKAPMVVPGLEQGVPNSSASRRKLKRGLMFHKQNTPAPLSNRA